jgi:uncharacterized hydrophobic protein (TIGR00271 family)
VSAPAAGPHDAAPARDAAPAWGLAEARIRANAVYPPAFFVLLTIAGLIGAVGILINSQILIVGAMVVGPEYNAIMGTALGLSGRDTEAITRGLVALGAGFGAAIVATLVFGLVIHASGQTPQAYYRGVRPVGDLIASPDVFSVVVAVLAGIAGPVSLTEVRAATLVGVFISVTTIPAAANLGLSIAYADWSRALGSTYQLLLNVVVLIVIGVVVLTAARSIWPARPGASPSERLPGALEEVLADPDRVGHHGQGRVHRADAREEAGVSHVQVVDLVRLAVGVEHRGRRVGAEPAGAGLVGHARDRDGHVHVEVLVQQVVRGQSYVVDDLP